jgi:molecular chaperone GrpE
MEGALAEEDSSGKPADPDDDEREDADPAEALAAAEPAATLGDVLEAPPGTGPAEAFHQRARLAEDRLAEVLAAYRKLKGETDALRERTTRNLERKYQQRHEGLLLRFMAILDNLDRALEAAETSYGGQPLIEGLILVRTQLVQMLQEEGLERIPVLGLPYDPHVSEVVATTPVQDPDHHHVVMKEMLRGYRISGRVARASQVVVGEYRDTPTVAAPPDETPSPTAKTQPIPTLVAPPSDTGDETLDEILARAERRAGAAPPEPPDEDE